MAEESDASLNITSIDMFSMGGFALFFGWMLVVFFWLFCDFPPGVPIAMRDVTQLTVFVGTPQPICSSISWPRTPSSMSSRSR